MSQATPTTLDSGKSDASFSRLRILHFRVRQCLDWWSQTTFGSSLASCLVMAGVSLRNLGLRRPGLMLLLSGRRLARNAKADAAIQEFVALDRDGRGELFRLLRKPGADFVSSYAGRFLILKMPLLVDRKVVEKGALIIKFTSTFDQALRCLDVQRLMEFFRVILEPSWVGYSSPSILAWTAFNPEKVIVMAPYQPDYDFLQALDSNLVPVTLGPADWVAQAKFNRLENVEKIYDAIYVANFNPKKRVDRYLRAVVRVHRARPDFRAALVCAGYGREQSGRAIRDTITWARSKAKLDFFSGTSQSRLNELFNQSKVNVLLSVREGMNKGLAEGLFAGTPALLLAESACGNHRHMNSQTGRVVPDRELESTLDWFADNYAEFRPHEWAKKKISSRSSTDSLSKVLRELEIAEGRAWTRDLLPKVNQPEMRYLDPNDNWLMNRRVELLEAFAKAGGSGSVDELFRGASVGDAG